MLEIFFQSMLIGYSGAIMPGSLLTYTLEKSIKFGTKAGLIISLGHVLLELIVVILIFFGIGKYLSSSLAQLLIGFMGGILLLFLGGKMIKDGYLKKITLALHNEAGVNFGNLFSGGVLISAANPYFTVWWAVVGLGLMMKAYYAYGVPGVTLFYLGHITSDLSWYVLVSALISKTRAFINLKAYRMLIVILGACLIGFGVKFLSSAGQILLRTL